MATIQYYIINVSIVHTLKQEIYQLNVFVLTNSQMGYFFEAFVLWLNTKSVGLVARQASVERQDTRFHYRRDQLSQTSQKCQKLPTAQ